MSIDPKAGALGNLPIGKRKRALWRAFKRWPEDPRLHRWVIDRYQKKMADNLGRALMGEFVKSIAEPFPLLGLEESLKLNPWRSISGSCTVDVKPTELEPT